MGKAVFIFLILCAVIGGTVWLKKYRPKTPFFEATESVVTELLDEAKDTLFLKQPPPPDPEAITRFKNAVDRELERLNASRQQTRQAIDETATRVQVSPGIGQ